MRRVLRWVLYSSSLLWALQTSSVFPRKLEHEEGYPTLLHRVVRCPQDLSDSDRASLPTQQQASRRTHDRHSVGTSPFPSSSPPARRCALQDSRPALSSAMDKAAAERVSATRQTGIIVAFIRLFRDAHLGVVSDFKKKSK